jgi:hypothetical protein
VRLRGIVVLKNRNLLLEFHTAEAARWLRASTIQEVYLGLLGNLATFKNRLFPVIMQFVSVDFNPGREDNLRFFEETNGLDSGAVSHAHWIKDPGDRSPSQKTAHARFFFSSPQAANRALSENVYIQEKRITTKKPCKEPLRCMKCHKFGHEARHCKSIDVVCGTCTHAHKTWLCERFAPPRCINCPNGMNRHASSSRDCPEFLRRCSIFDAKYPENTIPFYPTNEEWTWARNYAKAPPYSPPAPLQPQPPPRQRGLRQSTLNFGPVESSNHPQLSPYV